MLLLGGISSSARAADGPVANYDYALVGPTPAFIPVLRNDTDTSTAGGQPSTLRIKSVSKPHRGTATIAGSFIVYKPGAFFDDSDFFDYTIVNAAGQEASSSIIIGAWKYVKGTYILNIPPDSGLPNGRVALTVTGPGAYTAAVTLRDSGSIRVWRFSGGTDATGELKLNLGSYGVLALSLSGRGWGNGVQVPAEFRDKAGNIVAQLGLTPPVVYQGLEGKYTLAGNGDQYAGWAVFQIYKSARVTMSGRMSNGKPFSSGAWVTGGADFNFLYKSPAYLVRDRVFIDDNQVAEGRITLRSVTRPEDPDDGSGFMHLVVDGVYENFPIAVSRYTPPAARAPWFSGNNLKIVVARSVYSPPLETTATLVGDRATVTAPLASLIFQRSKSDSTPEGTFRGRLTPPIGTVSGRFSGVMFQKTGKAVGFVEGYRSPAITITPE